MEGTDLATGEELESDFTSLDCVCEEGYVDPCKFEANVFYDENGELSDFSDSDSPVTVECGDPDGFAITDVTTRVPNLTSFLQ